MSIDPKTIEYLAHLARIQLDPAQLKELSMQLKDILDFIDQLKELDTSGIQPTSHILEIKNVMRNDLPVPCLTNVQAIANAPDKDCGFFAVPKVID